MSQKQLDTVTKEITSLQSELAALKGATNKSDAAKQ